MDDRRDRKKVLLYLLVGSVILSAVLGIVMVLRNTWDWYEIRVMLTTITIAVASLCGLAGDFSRTPRGLNLLPKASLLLTFASAVLILILIWLEIHHDGYLQATAIVSIFAIAVVHVSLLSNARLADRFRWVYLIAMQVIFGLAALLSAMILFELDDEGMFQFVAALAILDAALTLVIPLLHRISKADVHAAIATPLEERNLAAIDEQIAVLQQQVKQLEKLRAELVAGSTGQNEPR